MIDLFEEIINGSQKSYMVNVCHGPKYAPQLSAYGTKYSRMD